MKRFLVPASYLESVCDRVSIDVASFGFDYR